MLEFLEIEREASDERLAVQSGEDHRDFEGSRLQDEHSCAGSMVFVYGRFEKDGLIFHDLHHTFNTNMRKAEVAESAIMAITGH